MSFPKIMPKINIIGIYPNETRPNCHPNPMLSPTVITTNEIIDVNTGILFDKQP